MRRDLLICFLLAAAVATVYWPVNHYPFINLDDYTYLTQNRFVKDGFTWEGVAQAFQGVTVGNWHPATSLSHMLVCQLFGVKATGWHHTANLLLHIANTLLLFVALRRTTSAVWQSAFVAALFGLHPLHVESVAWVAERKDVLSMFFFLLTLLAYFSYAKRPNVPRYLLVALCTALALMSKPMLVTLPFVLLLLDYWPLGRMAPAQPVEAMEDVNAEDANTEDAETEYEPDGESEAPDSAEPVSNEVVPEEADESPDRESDMPWKAAGGQYSSRQLIVEKLPLFFLVAVDCLMTLIAQQMGGAMGMLGQSAPFYMRVANAAIGYERYLEKTFWPRGLVVFYPYIVPRTIDLIVVVLALAAITVAALRLRTQKPYMAVGWFWYLGTLVPVIGLVQAGAQSIADRYTYIPLVGVFIIAAWGAAEFTALWPTPAKVLAAVAVLLACGLATSRQVTYWSSNEALFTHAFAVMPENFFAHHGLGNAYWEQHRYADAVKEFEAELDVEKKFKLRNGLEPAHRALGVLYGVLGRPVDALQELDKSITMQPRQADSYRHKAWLLATYPDETYRDGPKAVELAEKARQFSHYETADTFDTLGAAQAEAGNFVEARKAAEKAIELAPQTGDGDMIPIIKKRIDLYAHEKAFHAPLTRPRRL